jgi:o-succinylbenzoate---CoA ligase
MDRLDLARLLGAPLAVAEGSNAPIAIEESDPLRFMSAFTTAVTARGPVFLCDPSWGEGERAKLRELIGQAPQSPTGKERGWLCIPTGGTSGGLKFARHDEETLAAAVRGFGAHFGMRRVHALGVLPLHHVSGLMAWMRCAWTGGKYLPWDWKALERGERPALSADGPWVISLVPTQLQRLLANAAAVEWLRQFHVVFVGGGPTWPALFEAAGRAGVPVAISYGMTETAAMVTALRPHEFLTGERSCGTALPHAQVKITAEGLVAISGDSLFRGYFPEERWPVDFVTEDLGRLDARGHLHVLGRRDATIITGGKKVQPLEVEAALRASGQFEDVAVVGLPDAEWGEVVVACYPANQPAPDVARASAALTSHQRPKRFVPVTDWPRNAQGKVNRAALLASLSAN